MAQPRAWTRRAVLGLGGGLVAARPGHAQVPATVTPTRRVATVFDLVPPDPRGYSLTSGVRLAYLPTGFAGQVPEPIAEYTSRPEVTPIHLSCDVTLQVNGIRERQEFGYFVQYLRGAPIVFASTLEVVWEME